MKLKLVNLPVTIFREGEYFVTYSPVLDLSTSAKSFKVAQKRFQEIVSIFFEEIAKKGTTDEVLQELGWKKIKKNWTPPTVISNEPQVVEIPLKGLKCHA